MPKNTSSSIGADSILKVHSAHHRLILWVLQVLVLQLSLPVCEFTVVLVLAISFFLVIFAKLSLIVKNVFNWQIVLGLKGLQSLHEFWVVSLVFVHIRVVHLEILKIWLLYHS